MAVHFHLSAIAPHGIHVTRPRRGPATHVEHGARQKRVYLISAKTKDKIGYLRSTAVAEPRVTSQNGPA